MPKYIPTDEDVWNTNPCPICGDDIITTGANTCDNWKCDQMYKIMQKDWEYFLYKDHERE